MSRVFRVSWGSSIALALFVVLGACSETVSDGVLEVEPDVIRPFNVRVSEEILDDLDDRLRRARLPDQIPGTDWSYGTDGAYLSRSS